jgi:hypothetical protein
MIMRLLNLFFILGVLTVFISCEKKEPTLNSEAKLLGITLVSGNGVMDTANKKVIIKVPESVDLTKIVPHFTISTNATIYPPSDVATDYTNQVVYTITSEDKAKQYILTVSASKSIAKFTVYDCTNWSPTVTRIAQANAVIKIYSKEEDVNTSKTYDVLTTDQNGQADFYGSKKTAYFLTIQKDNKSNILNGYVLDGRYNTQAEVDNSGDPNAILGGFKFKDINGDGRVWPDDKYNYDFLWIYNYNSGIKLIDLYIASAN